MARPRLDPDRVLTPAERAKRYRVRHGDRINRALRICRRAIERGELSTSLRVRLTQLDGVLPNMALMKLAAYHKARGDVVLLSRSPYRSPTEPNYHRVYTAVRSSRSPPSG
jgi:hypothetical protein